MTMRTALRLLLGLAIGLPMGQALLFWVAALLVAMGDQGAATVIRHLGTAVGVAWLTVLVGLVLTLAVKGVNESGHSHDDGDELNHD